MAATDAKRRIKGVPCRISFPLWLSTNWTLQTAAGGLDSEYSGDGAAFADCASEAVELAAASGIYYLDLSAAEMNYDQIVVQIKSSTANVQPAVVEILTEPSLHSGTASGGTSVTITLPSGASSTDDYYNGALVEIASGTGAGQVRTITDYTGSTRVATVDRTWVTTPTSGSYYIIHPKQSPALTSAIKANADVLAIDGDTTAAANMSDCYLGWVIPDTMTGTPTTTTFQAAGASISSTDDFYNEAMIFITSGTYKGLARRVTDYTGSSKTFTISPALPGAPAASTAYIIASHIE